MLAAAARAGPMLAAGTVADRSPRQAETYGHAPVASSLSWSGADRCRGAYRRTWFRPASLARYKARSAAASSSDRLLPGRPSTATPIDTVTLILASFVGSAATLSRPA